MSESIQLAHNRKGTVVLTRVGHPPGTMRQHTYHHVSAASLKRLERLARANGFKPLPRKCRIKGWWQREKA